ncbi:MAG: Asp23/Gls24 family envelope stress response protein [Eubacterium sp.]|nr:Asp23/Gls24 family envelope stress response protein [Eubacterium sp.]
MAEDRRNLKIKEDKLGEVRVADDVVAMIAGLAATEVDGVTSMYGNITNELVSKLGKKNLSRGIKIQLENNVVRVDIGINIAYGYEIPAVSEKVQEKVKSAIENMTGLEVSSVNVRIASVDIKKK